MYGRISVGRRGSTSGRAASLGSRLTLKGVEDSGTGVGVFGLSINGSTVLLTSVAWGMMFAVPISSRATLLQATLLTFGSIASVTNSSATASRRIARVRPHMQAGYSRGDRAF